MEKASVSDFELEEKYIFLIKMLLFFSPLVEIWSIYKYKYEVWAEDTSKKSPTLTHSF